MRFFELIIRLFLPSRHRERQLQLWVPIENGWVQSRIKAERAACPALGTFCYGFPQSGCQARPTRAYPHDHAAAYHMLLCDGCGDRWEKTYHRR